MPTKVDNSFTSYKFSERELLESAILAPLQKQRIQTLLSEIAEQKLGLAFDIDRPLAKIAQDAFLDGQIGILRTLLLASEESETQLLRLMQEGSQRSDQL